jgi:phosphomannomutase
VRLADLSVIPGILRRLANEPPAELAGFALSSVTDLSVGGDLPPTDGVILHFHEGLRVIVRPSGTEPKIKCYLELVLPIADSYAIARESAAARLQSVKEAVRAQLGV